MPTLNLYRLKVWLVGARAQPMSKLHRIIEISGNATFANLHELIFDAFDREDDHLYRFYLTRKEEPKSGDYLFQDCKETVSREIMDLDDLFADEEEIDDEHTEHLAAEYTLDDARLAEKDNIYYWFDFGDDWIHRIKIEKIRQVKEEDEGVWFGDISKKVGESPAQYGEDSVWDEDGGGTRSLRLFTLLGELADPNATPVTWDELEAADLAEPLLAQKLIEPRNAIDPNVRLTAEGRAAAEILLQMRNLATENGQD